MFSLLVLVLPQTEVYNELRSFVRKLLGLYQATTRQFLPVFLDALSELLDETVVDDWFSRMANVVAIGQPWLQKDG